MVAAPDHDVSALSHAGSPSSALDARLFSLIEELRKCEKRRDELLDRLSIEQGEQIEAAAKKASMPPGRSMSGSPQSKRRHGPGCSASLN